MVALFTIHSSLHSDTVELSTKGDFGFNAAKLNKLPWAKRVAALKNLLDKGKPTKKSTTKGKAPTKQNAHLLAATRQIQKVFAESMKIHKQVSQAKKAADSDDGVNWNALWTGAGAKAPA
eukprot:CAMPEP_0117076282 /NCGR_PEP_ID=MMETSP0472-20121206/53774_1 /TAXON_ID=693140 ORGANISM="Tiarina fusus, Strain LIS" /NCGR_SAMPLE_ID=MMETSP0472 /ASSEMBLY_ACC=CAM_ASM_000603 /LENGTH=119 /DNA_ID=CAMNT_0004802119 /DNA_START=42 /DNA_END=397 /DNA_ORIENTATION=+